MSQARQESKRVHHEMEKFYVAHPEYRIQANHQIFTNYAESLGGTEYLSVASMTEWASGPLRGQLAVLQETPNEAFEKFFAEYPAYNFEASRRALAEHISPRPVSSDTLRQAFSELKNQLPFDADIASQHLAQKEAVERASLIDKIVLDYSRSGFAQDNYRKTLERVTLEQLRLKAQNIEARKHFGAMSTEDLKHVVRQDADRRRAGLNPTLPIEISAETIRSASSGQLYDWNKRYGYAVLNDRLAGRS